MRRTVCSVLVVVSTICAACSTDPEVAKQEYFAEGNRYMAGKKYMEAIVSYRNAIKQDDKFGEARLKLAEAYFATNDVRNALAESVRAADIMPDNVDAQLSAGALLLAARRYPEARARATAALSKEPRNARALVLLGNSLAGLKEVDAAIEQVEQAIDEDPSLTLSYANLGDLYSAKGDKEAALSAFTRAVDADPKAVFPHLSLANFLWSSGKRDEAERELKTALELEPQSPGVNRALATFYIVQNNLAAAEPYMKAYANLAGSEAKLALGDFYVLARKSTDAVGLLTELAKQPEYFIPATLRLAVVDFNAGRRADAYKKVEEALQREPKNEAALQAKARFLVIDHKNSEGLAIAEKAVAANPRSARSRYIRGLAFEATGAIDQAVTDYEEVLKALPAALPVQARLASLHLTQGRFRDALQLSQGVVKARPQSTDAHFVYAQALFKSGDLTGAERELSGLAKLRPNSPDVYTWIGMLYEAKNDLARARASFERALALEPGSRSALAGLVDVDLKTGKTASALDRIEKQAAANPRDPQLAMMKGHAYFAVRDFAKAETAFRTLLDLEPNSMDGYSNLGALYILQNRLDEARKTFEEMATRDKNPVVAETMLGTILVRQNNSGEARKHFERAIQLNPRAAVAANNLAWDYATTGGNLDTALKLAQTAKAELPDNAVVTDTLGWIYYQKGLASLAVTTLREASDQNPKNANIRYHLGLAHLKNGDKVAARSLLEEVLRLNPSFQNADDVRRVLASIS
jgi:tetratricopeptide (TPR) repeat protein